MSTLAPTTTPFQPRFCPYLHCPSHAGLPFLYNQKGAFRRRCDGRVVPRFKCLTCHRGFSEQTFRVNYRLKRPELLPRFFHDRISKVTHRQSARIHTCSRTTEERHFRRLAEHGLAFHDLRLKELARAGGKGQVFLLDELETYEEHRKLKPVTVPVLIERDSGFVVDTRAAPLAPRGRRTPREEQQLQRQTEREGPRECGSRQAIEETLARLKPVCAQEGQLVLLSDQKKSYAELAPQKLGERCVHERFSSKLRRDTRNPLWPINHTLARLRDGLSRLVRETWAAAKRRARLAGHLGIWVSWRNYVRGITNTRPDETPAMVLGATKRRWNVPELLEWRVFPWE